MLARRLHLFSFLGFIVSTSVQGFVSVPYIAPSTTPSTTAGRATLAPSSCYRALPLQPPPTCRKENKRTRLSLSSSSSQQPQSQPQPQPSKIAPPKTQQRQPQRPPPRETEHCYLYAHEDEFDDHDELDELAEISTALDQASAVGSDSSYSGYYQSEYIPHDGEIAPEELRGANPVSTVAASIAAAVAVGSRTNKNATSGNGSNPATNTVLPSAQLDNPAATRPPSSSPLASAPTTKSIHIYDHHHHDMEKTLQFLSPFLTPLLAYLSYDLLARSFAFTVDLLGNNNWVAVDGGAYQARIIAPAINGVVVPAIAVLFATLTSTTISTLRQRQVDVRQCINMEAGELRVMECLLDSFPAGKIQDVCRNYLIQYTTRVIAECNPRLGSASDVVNPSRSMDSELVGFIRQLNESYDRIPSNVAAEAYAALARLREQRQNRITALQSTYPSLHYMILGILSTAECIAFLMETDQEMLIFLNAIQLKLLWTMLVSTFVACFAVFYDLRSPFSGNYQISASVDQLYTIRLALKAAREMAEEETRKREEQSIL